MGLREILAESKRKLCQEEAQSDAEVMTEKVSDEEILQEFDGLLQYLLEEGTGWNVELLDRGLKLYHERSTAVEQEQPAPVEEISTVEEPVPAEEQPAPADRSADDHAAAHQAALAAVEQCSRAADSLYEISCRMMDFRRSYQELTDSLRGDFHELNQQYKGTYLEPGLQQLCLLERELSCAPQECAPYARKLRCALQERFGCLQILPAPGEIFDAQRMEMEIIDPSARQAPVCKTVTAGWKRGGQILCKAIVSMKQEEA